MKIIKELYGSKIHLRKLKENDVGQSYLRWMNDKDLLQYMESRYQNYTILDLKDYVFNLDKDKSAILWGIFENANQRHVGNIKLGSIQWIHKTGDIGILVGERDVWGRGYATQAIELASAYAFSELNLNKITAGIYSENKGSEAAFIKAGFQREGLLKSQYIYKDKTMDKILMGIENPSLHSKNITNMGPSHNVNNSCI